jgi:hypothetical protein
LTNVSAFRRNPSNASRSRNARVFSWSATSIQATALSRQCLTAL